MLSDRVFCYGLKIGLEESYRVRVSMIVISVGATCALTASM